MKVQKVIQELDRKNYSMLVQNLKENKADKFLFLLTGYRSNKADDSELQKKLDVSQAAFYTLKSRLADKVQEFLYENTPETRVQLLQNVANIDSLIYKTPRATAISILKKIEAELIAVDMPNELVIVYRAFKKIYVHSDKYHEYSQLYNKSVAFNLGQDKAEDILCSFCKILGEYYLNRNEQLLDILVLYKKEMKNICKLYESHHLHLYKNILDIHFALFSPVKKELEEDDTIEDMLKNTVSIIETNKEHRNYKHLQPTLDFLFFEYYVQLKLYKNAATYYQRLIDNSPTIFINNYGSFIYHFLISKIEFAIANKEEKDLYKEAGFDVLEVNKEDVSSYLILNYYKACTQYYSNNYTGAIKTLNSLINEISFLNISFFECQIKSFLTLLYIIDGTPIQAVNLIKNVSRKILEENDETKYNLQLLFVKLLKVALSPIATNKYEKLVELTQNIAAITNNATTNAIQLVKLDDSILKLLVKLGNDK